MSRRLAALFLLPSLAACGTLRSPSLASWSACARNEAAAMLAKGATASWPSVAELPTGEPIEVVDLGQDPPEAIADGFNHVLHLAPQHNAFYVHQTGGFAGLDRIYGPVSLQGRCRAPKPGAP